MILSKSNPKGALKQAFDPIDPQYYHQKAHIGIVLALDIRQSPTSVVTTDIRHYRPQIRIFWEFLLSQMAWFAPTKSFGGTLRGSQRGEIKLITSTLRILAIWTIMWCLKPNHMPYETLRVNNNPVKGHSRPPLNPLLTPVGPPMSPQWPKITQYYPASCSITYWHSQHDHILTKVPEIA